MLPASGRRRTVENGVWPVALGFHRRVNAELLKSGAARKREAWAAVHRSVATAGVVPDVCPQAATGRREKQSWIRRQEQKCHPSRAAAHAVVSYRQRYWPPAGANMGEITRLRILRLSAPILCAVWLALSSSISATPYATDRDTSAPTRSWMPWK